MQFEVSKTLVFVGLMGAGKSAIGSLVAQKLGIQFLDTDAEIEKAANMTVAEIFARDGEPFFRQKETQVLARLLESEPCILSTGGGAFLSKTNQDLIADKGAAVWLQVDLNVLWERVRHKTTRPLLLTPDPYQTLSDLYYERLPAYSKAQIRVESTLDLTLQEMASKVIQVLVNDPHSGVVQKEI